LRGLLNSFGFADPEKQKLVLREIDKLEKIGKDKVCAAVVELGLAPPLADTLLNLIAHKGTTEEIYTELAKQNAVDAVFQEGLEELRQMIVSLKALGVPAKRARLNLSIARGLDYYTGTVYETLLDAHPEFGSVCSGGRYDDLASHYTKSKLPGVGISIGLTRLFDQLNAHQLLPSVPNTVQILIAQFDPSWQPGNLVLAKELRAAGFRVDTWLEQSKPDKQIKYADKLGIPVVLLQGPDEVAKGAVVVKNMAAKTQDEVKRADLVAKLRGILGN
jgi:histidyl-tRNA synthetase